MHILAGGQPTACSALLCSEIVTLMTKCEDLSSCVHWQLRPALQQLCPASPQGAMLCLALTSCTVLAGQTGMPPCWGSGRSTSSSEHSGLLVSLSQTDETGFSRHLTCLMNTSSGPTILYSRRNPAPGAARLTRQSTMSLEDLLCPFEMALLASVAGRQADSPQPVIHGTGSALRIPSATQ